MLLPAAKSGCVTLPRVVVVLTVVVVTVVVVVHQDDFTLSLLIGLLQLLVLPSFVLDSLNELSLHSRLGW